MQAADRPRKVSLKMADSPENISRNVPLASRRRSARNILRNISLGSRHRSAENISENIPLEAMCDLITELDGHGLTWLVQHERRS